MELCPYSPAQEDMWDAVKLADLKGQIPGHRKANCGPAKQCNNLEEILVILVPSQFSFQSSTVSVHILIVFFM